MTQPVICADSDDAYDDDDHKEGDVVRDDDGDSDLMPVTSNAIAMFFSPPVATAAKLSSVRTRQHQHNCSPPTNHFALYYTLTLKRSSPEDNLSNKGAQI